MKCRLDLVSWAEFSQFERINLRDLVGGEVGTLCAHAFGDQGPQSGWEVAEREKTEHGREQKLVDLVVEDWVFRLGDETLRGSHCWELFRSYW